jgi:hypothetical protein
VKTLYPLTGVVVHVAELDSQRVTRRPRTIGPLMRFVDQPYDCVDLTVRTQLGRHFVFNLDVCVALIAVALKNALGSDTDIIGLAVHGLLHTGLMSHNVVHLIVRNQTDATHHVLRIV